MAHANWKIENETFRRLAHTGEFATPEHHDKTHRSNHRQKPRNGTEDRNKDKDKEH